MSDSNENSRFSDSENLCVVCCKDVKIYSVGNCDHPVCYECSTRMRVLCNQNECPICRGLIPKVVFTREIGPFNKLFEKYSQTHLQDRKIGLIFCSEGIKKAYQQLLEYRCSICTNNSEKRSTFYTFQQLKDHMRREHALVYCDLCVDNLKIFCFERKCYTKQELGYHRRKGDPDNTSHRGHPLCEFCDTRFMDSDELFRHLRRNHLFCHFCDADGKHQYYNSMDDLRCHFRDEHYLCEEGDCLNMPLIAVFRTDIDLKAHLTREHGRYLSKSASKQARTLELEFTLAPRPGTDRSRRHQVNSRPAERYDDEGAVGFDMEPGGPGGGMRQQVHSLTSQDFPALGGSSITVQSRPNATVNFMSKMNTFSGDDFPTLGGSRAPAVTITTNSSSSRKKAPEVTITRTLRPGGGSAQNLTKSSENFPRLGPPTSSSSGSVHLSVNTAPKVSIHVNHNSGVTTTHITSTSSSASAAPSNGFNVHQKPMEAFPVLGGVALPLNPKWVQQKPKKQQESRMSKVAPPPQLPPSDLSQFPTLSKNGGKSEKSTKKTSSVTVPVSGTWSTVSRDTNKQSNNNSNVNNRTNKNNDASSSKPADTGDNKSKNKKSKKKTSNNNNLTFSENEIKTNEPKTTTTADYENKNGVIKKRSELKIGNLTLTDSSDSNSSKPPPGFPTKPPPGFSNFTNQNFPNLSASNDLTFTNSSGQSYSIKPSNYHQPANFTTRNQNLIKKSMSLLDNDMIQEFKSYSALFRDGTFAPQRYYEYCKVVLDRNFNELFPELLVLLPDINKQQELYNACDDASKKNLVVCENCKQVVFKKELAEHYSYHSLDSHFPSLGKATDTSNVWKK